MAEITDADRERSAAFLASPGGPHTAHQAIAQLLADQRAELLSDVQYRAVLECTSDPCTYCARPAERFPVEHPKGPFPTEETARQHGRGMAEKVYGSNVHRVLVERRYVTGWQQVED